jgi:RNA polymerase sigma-70 factor (ECF subfamily)
MKLSREQFESAALEQMDMLYRVARRLTRDPDRAADLVQETYLRAIRGQDTFDMQEHGIRPWLVRIMHNLHFSRSDREKRQPALAETAALEAGQREGTSDPFPVAPGGFDAMDQRLVRALHQLPEEYQVVMMLWAVDELSYKEIAEAVDIPIGTVMSRLHRARQRLSEMLRDFATEEGVIRE